MMKAMFRILAFLALSLAIPFAYQVVAPFRLGKCRVEMPFNPVWEAEGTIPSLNRPFTYLAEGTQAYVFLSEDRKFVLKLFKNVGSVEKTLDACKLGYAIRDLTQVVFIHLNPKPGLPMIALKDQWRRTQRLDPASMRFILQRKANPFFKTLRTASNEERKRLIDSFYFLLQDMNKQGIANLDDSLGRNFGFIDGKAVAIDFGKFVYAPELTKEREAHLVRRLNKWLLKNNITL